MFGEKFKKASKSITASETVLQKSREIMLVTATQSAKRANYFVRAAVSFACISAVAVFGIWGIQLDVPPKDSMDTQQAMNNLFSISAYAYEQQENGQLKKKEIDLSQSSDGNDSEYIIAIRGGENNEYEATHIKLLGVECKGHSIQTVDFQIDSGTLKIPNEHWATEKLLKNLESKGTKLTVDYSKGVQPEIYWESDPFHIKFDTKEGATFTLGESQEKASVPVLSPLMPAKISVIVHFEDGSQAEKSIVYDPAQGRVILKEAE